MGIKVDEDVVSLEPELVKWALQTAPRHWSLYCRDGTFLPLEKGACYLSTYADALFVLDFQARMPRPSTQNDLEEFVGLGQALDAISIVNPVCYARDVPEPTQLLYTAKTVVQFSNKHTSIGPLNIDDMRTWYDLNQIASPGIDQTVTPTLSVVVSPTSPLVLDKDAAQVFQFAVGKRIPILACSCPMTGGTAPLSLIGTLVLHLAEDLFLLTLAQLMQEGTPVIIAGAAGIMDVRKGVLSYGAPERHLLLGALIDIANYYNLPHHSPAGSVDSWYPDVQTGAQKMQTWMARKAAGISLGVGFGSLSTGKVVSKEQLVIDLDLWQMVERYFSGIDLSRLQESVDVIRRVGHGGAYLMDDQTIALMRSKEIYLSDLVDLEGSPDGDMWARAHQQVRLILNSHQFECEQAIVEDITTYVHDKEKVLLKNAC
jgi:trimethylamine---corrinoid protein Co-methyltransferase